MIGLESDKNGPLEEEVITNIQDAQFLYILLKVFCSLLGPLFPSLCLLVICLLSGFGILCFQVLWLNLCFMFCSSMFASSLFGISVVNLQAACPLGGLGYHAG